jgi:hypothetical protein
MCCCGKPTINGEIGYRWNDPNSPPGIHSVNAPELDANDTLLYDEPGRCGGLDSHAYHYRLVRHSSSTFLLVRHGGGDERFRFSCTEALLAGFAAMDTSVRYWTFNAIYHACSDARQRAQENEAIRWRKAAAEKRIRTRKTRGEDTVKVWIVPSLNSK